MDNFSMCSLQFIDEWSVNKKNQLWVSDDDIFYNICKFFPLNKSYLPSDVVH